MMPREYAINLRLCAHSALAGMNLAGIFLAQNPIAFPTNCIGLFFQVFCIALIFLTP